MKEGGFMKKNTAWEWIMAEEERDALKAVSMESRPVLPDILDRVKVVEEKQDSLYKAWVMVGKAKLSTCRHLGSLGYCTFPGYGFPGSGEWKRQGFKVTLGKGGKYYPKATELLCSVCPFFLGKQASPGN